MEQNGIYESMIFTFYFYSITFATYNLLNKYFIIKNKDCIFYNYTESSKIEDTLSGLTPFRGFDYFNCLIIP